MHSLARQREGRRPSCGAMNRSPIGRAPSHLSHSGSRVGGGARSVNFILPQLRPEESRGVNELRAAKAPATHLRGTGCWAFFRGSYKTRVYMYEWCWGRKFFKLSRPPHPPTEKHNREVGSEVVVGGSGRPRGARGQRTSLLPGRRDLHSSAGSRCWKVKPLLLRGGTLACFWDGVVDLRLC